MFSLLPLINSSVTIGLCFLSPIISAITSIDTISVFLVSYLDCIHQYFYRHTAYHTEYSTKALKS